MNRRLHLWLGVSAYALLGAVTLPVPVFAEQGSSQDNDLDPDGGFQHECGEPGGCAEAGERFESRSADEFGEDEDNQPPGQAGAAAQRPRRIGRRRFGQRRRR